MLKLKDVLKRYQVKKQQQQRKTHQLILDELVLDDEEDTGFSDITDSEGTAPDDHLSCSGSSREDDSTDNKFTNVLLYLESMKKI